MLRLNVNPWIKWPCVLICAVMALLWATQVGVMTGGEWWWCMVPLAPLLLIKVFLMVRARRLNADPRVRMAIALEAMRRSR